MQSFGRSFHRQGDSRGANSGVRLRSKQEAEFEYQEYQKRTQDKRALKATPSGSRVFKRAQNVQQRVRGAEQYREERERAAQEAKIPQAMRMTRSFQRSRSPKALSIYERDALAGHNNNNADANTKRSFAVPFGAARNRSDYDYDEFGQAPDYGEFYGASDSYAPSAQSTLPQFEETAYSFEKSNGNLWYPDDYAYQPNDAAYDPMDVDDVDFTS